MSVSINETLSFFAHGQFILENSKQSAKRLSRNESNVLYVERPLKKNSQITIRIDECEPGACGQANQHGFHIGLSNCKPVIYGNELTCSRDCVPWLESDDRCQRRKASVLVNLNQPNTRVIVERFKNGKVSAFPSYATPEPFKIKETWHEWLFKNYYSCDKLYLFIVMDGCCSKISLVPPLLGFEEVEQAEEATEEMSATNDHCDRYFDGASAPPQSLDHMPSFGDASERRLCTICMAQDRNAFFVPCCHMVTCMDCAGAVRNSSNLCPICRAKIGQVVKVYLS